MSNSPLVTYTRISPNRSSPRTRTVDRMTIHCYVGQVTAEQGCSGSRFVNYDPVGGASCNYVVGRDGSIGLCVPESDRAWCSSSPSNDSRAITIETASDTTHPYAVTNEAYEALLDLCTDICRRHGKQRLVWLGDKDKTLAYQPAENEMVLTVHRWFAAKACPGQYLLDRQGAIAEEVTRRLQEEIDTMTYEQWKEYMARYQKELAAQNATMPDLVADAVALGISADGARPRDLMTREEGMVMATAAVRAAKKDPA